MVFLLTAMNKAIQIDDVWARKKLCVFGIDTSLAVWAILVTL
jgi:hypothetical protein